MRCEMGGYAPGLRSFRIGKGSHKTRNVSRSGPEGEGCACRDRPTTGKLESHEITKTDSHLRACHRTGGETSVRLELGSPNKEAHFPPTTVRTVVPWIWLWTAALRTAEDVRRTLAPCSIGNLAEGGLRRGRSTGTRDAGRGRSFWSAVAVGLLAAPSRARGRARVWRRRPAACGPCAAGCVAARGARVGPPRSGGARPRGRAATLWCRARRAVVVVRGLRVLRWLRGLWWLRGLRSRSCGGCGDEGCAIRRNFSSRIYRSAAVAAQFCDSAQFGKPEILGAFGLGPRSRSARLLEAVSG